MFMVRGRDVGRHAHQQDHILALDCQVTAGVGDLPFITEIYDNEIATTTSLFDYDSVSVENSREWLQAMQRDNPLCIVVETEWSRQRRMGGIDDGMVFTLVVEAEGWVSTVSNDSTRAVEQQLKVSCG
ncbi:hypothetical protein EW146_g2960 [Bondarzewia mesenterica]|uniref:Uncharacterized protein n=1 Tax=Bondarzewia mesenterica TaxID=1095465 RepID=A0A4S4M1D1_9AGAM|nr:hypothetical protein EW146_g2960 [Bondarzewia mesenterica]